jgi:hypothetical protein
MQRRGERERDGGGEREREMEGGREREIGNAMGRLALQVPIYNNVTHILRDITTH